MGERGRERECGYESVGESVGKRESGRARAWERARVGERERGREGERWRARAETKLLHASVWSFSVTTCEQ